MDAFRGCFFVLMIIGVFVLFGCTVIKIFNEPINHDPKKGEVHTSDSLWEWCKGPDMFYQPDTGFSRPLTIRVNDPECR